tara:strand:+ start:137 stop:406 length:270 start_codon:yes stop_codon:yes gene_type:complete
MLLNETLTLLHAQRSSIQSMPPFDGSQSVPTPDPPSYTLKLTNDNEDERHNPSANWTDLVSRPLLDRVVQMLADPILELNSAGPPYMDD